MTSNPAATMDRMYRHQRHVYDATRKFYLFGRDRLIRELAPAPGDRLLEIGCGTARNLIRVARRHPQVALYGIDASARQRCVVMRGPRPARRIAASAVLSISAEASMP